MLLIIMFLGIIYLYIATRQYLVREQFITTITVDKACPKCRNPDCPFLKTGICPFAGTGDCMMRRYLADGFTNPNGGLEGFGSEGAISNNMHSALEGFSNNDAITNNTRSVLEGFVTMDPQDLDKAFLGSGEGPYTSWPGGVVSPPPYADSPVPRPMCIPGYNKK